MRGKGHVRATGQRAPAAPSSRHLQTGAPRAWPATSHARSHPHLAALARVAPQAVLRIPHSEEWLSPLLTVVPLQLLSYYVATLRKLDVDQPRNLAKSVTVE